MDVTSVLSLHPHLLTLHFMNLLNSKMKVTQVFVLHQHKLKEGVRVFLSRQLKSVETDDSCMQEML